MKKTKMKIVFLDMDGVVNSAVFFEAPSKRSYKKKRGRAKAEALQRRDHSSMIDPANVVHLNVIVEATQARFVLSSTWRLHYTHKQVEEMLRGHGFVGTLVSHTPNDLGDVDRGHEIQAWLDERPHLTVESFVILDDGSDMTHLQPRLVQTSWERGLEARHAAEAIRLLSE